MVEIGPFCGNLGSSSSHGFWLGNILFLFCTYLIGVICLRKWVLKYHSSKMNPLWNVQPCMATSLVSNKGTYRIRILMQAKVKIEQHNQYFLPVAQLLCLSYLIWVHRWSWVAEFTGIMPQKGQNVELAASVQLMCRKRKLSINPCVIYHCSCIPVVAT